MLRERTGALVDVRKEADAFTVTPGLLGDMLEDLHECFERVFAGHNADLSQRPGFIKADMIPRAGKELRRLLDPVVQHLIHTRIARVVDRKSTRLNSSHLGIS